MAAWKPKEKPLTAEEAIALARKELAKYWFGSAPLLAGVPAAGGYAAHPLDSEFQKKSWLLVFADPTTYAGEAALARAREWHRRYSGHALGTVVLFRQPYSRLHAAETVQLMMRKQQIECIVAIDADGFLAGAFGVRELPKFVLMEKKTVLFEQEGPNWYEGAELRVQQFLRERDPGLSMLVPFEPPKAVARDVAAFELGEGKVTEGITWAGEWKKEGETASTSDSKAELSFRSSGSRVSVVALSLSKLPDPARVAVEVNGVPAYDSFAGESLMMSDDGNAEARIESGSLYHLLANLPPDSRQITLRFPFADRIPIGLLGLRIGD